MSNSINIGRKAEQAALHYLLHQGLHLLQTNYFCKYGEIDLVMLDKDALCFIEVRARKNGGYASATESIDRRKQGKIIKTALCFLQQFTEYESYNCRFDVVAFDYVSIQQFDVFFEDIKQQSLILQWIQDAYTM